MSGERKNQPITTKSAAAAARAQLLHDRTAGCKSHHIFRDKQWYYKIRSLSLFQIARVKNGEPATKGEENWHD